MMDRRVLIGWIALGTLAAGIATWLLQPTDNWQVVMASFLRVGTFLSVLWLAYPDLKAIPAWAWSAIMISGIIIAVRPRAAIILLPLMALSWLLKLKLR